MTHAPNMETNTLLNIVRDSWKRILAFAVLTALVAVVAATALPPRYHTSLALAITIHRQDTQEYQYDGYYALQAADLFSQTLMSWFTTPAVVRDILNRAQRADSQGSLEQSQGVFRVQKASGQNVVVSYASLSRDEADRIAESIRQVVTEHARALNQTPQGESIFSVDVSEPFTLENKTSPLVAGAAGLILGLAIMIGVEAALKALGTLKK